MKPLIIIALILISLWLIATGWTDLDWQIVSYRYSSWHRTISYWEYNPYLQVNWWLAYILNLGRIMVGCFIMGVISHKIIKDWRIP